MTQDTKEAIAARHKHARKCKRQLGDCATCQQHVAWFQKLDLKTLAEALADYPTRK